MPNAKIEITELSAIAEITGDEHEEWYYPRVRYFIGSQEVTREVWEEAKERLLFEILEIYADRLREVCDQ